MSKIQVNDIVNHFDDGAPNFPKGIVVGSGATLGFNVGTGASIYSPSDNVLTLGTNNSERLRIASDGDVGVGNNNPTYKVSVKDTKADGTGVQMHLWNNSVDNTAGNVWSGIRFTGSTGDYETAEIKGWRVHPGTNLNSLSINTGGVERMVLSSSGVGIGTNAPRGKLEVSDGTSNTAGEAINEAYIVGATTGNSEGILTIQSNNAMASDKGGSIAFGGRAVTSSSAGANWAFINGYKENGTTANYGGYLSFATRPNTGSIVERMRIRANGSMTMGDPSSSGDGGWSVFTSDAGTTSQRGRMLFYAKSGTSGVQEILQVYNGSSHRLLMRADGNLYNVAGGIGVLSDLKLKENIVSANSQWDDIKAIQIRNFNFKEETGYDTHTQIGVVAQEVETVSPGLVSDQPDKDKDGNELGTVTKVVTSSLLYMKAVKALQEAMERIETLEQRLADAGIA